MAVTPFIKPLNVQGGTFFTFSSSAEDLGLTFNNTSTKFKFSKYVLLNIPNIATPAFADNKIQFNTIDGALIQGLDPDNNINLAQSFQNYCLNLEAMLISQTNYDRTLKLNVAERVFFKWMKELGGIRFQSANSMQTPLNLITTPRYTEETEVLTGSLQYDRVVQYIGDIDIVNSVQNTTNAYTEIYIHVPTNDGNTPLVLFKTTSDVNYQPDMELIHQPTDPLDIGIINGRHYSDTQPAGLSIEAIFDQEVLGQPISMFFNTITSLYDIPENWYDPRTGPHAYFTDSVFTDPGTDKIQKTYGLNVVTFQRSRLDGITLDFDPVSYKPIVDNPTISTIQEYNGTVDAQPFKFNAVLVYYDVYDPNNLSDFATNLYGVLFLGDVETISTEFGIPRFDKFRPNVVTKLNGNSFGFKINLKFDTSVDNAGVEKAINDFSTFSMDLFVDSMNVFQQAATVLNEKIIEIQTLTDKVTTLEDLVINVDQFNEIDLRLTTLETSFQTNQALFNNTSDVIGLIDNVNTELNNLIEGKTSISVSYNLDVIKQGPGIIVDRSVPNVITIDNANQGFTISTVLPYQGDLSTGPTIKLQPFNNYFRHFINGVSIISPNDIYIKIDDTTNQWQRGQTFRLVVEDILDLGSNNMIISTDANNLFGNGNYGMIVGVLSGAEFDTAGDRPIFDITCVDPTNLIFVIDQIR